MGRGIFDQSGVKRESGSVLTVFHGNSPDGVRCALWGRTVIKKKRRSAKAEKRSRERDAEGKLPP